MLGTVRNLAATLVNTALRPIRHKAYAEGLGEGYLTGLGVGTRIGYQAGLHDGDPNTIRLAHILGQRQAANENRQ